ncbi:MAG: tetratricopeptide repeat-containing sensor histidine kinase [Bacteroidia bacterium]|nr:tetratricopeptide repeat-containing sensor histidine kinase [Bacteroidia bacterium]
MKLLSINKYLFTLIAVILCKLSFAQLNDTVALDKRIDSIYLYKNDSAFAFSTTNDVIKKSKEINYKKGIASATQLKGYLYFEYGDFENAKKYLYEAYELNKILNDDKTMAQNLRLLAIYLDGLEKFNEALELLFKSLHLRKKIGDEKGIAECYISLGIIYHRMLKFQTAISYYNKALAYFKNKKTENKIGAIYSNLGAVYNQMGKLDSALFYLEKVVLVKQKTNDKIGLGKAYHNIGTTYGYLGKYKESLNYYNKAIESSGGGATNSNNAISYEAAGTSLVKLKRYDEAEKFLNISKDLYLKNDLKSLLVDCYGNLSFLYEAKGDYKNSVKYNALCNFMKDSVQRIETQSSFAEVEAKYKAIEKTYENELLTSKNKLLENEAKYNKILLVCILLLLIAALFLIINLRTAKKTKNEVFKQYEIIEAKNKESAIQNIKLTNLLEENQILMGVLAHDLRSPLIKIVGLINLIEEQDTSEKEKLEYINYIQGICKDSLQLIQDTIDLSELFHEKNSAHLIKKETFKAAEMTNEILKTFKGNALEKRIEIKINNEQNNIDIYNSKDHLKRILDNLVSNAIKFSPINSTIIIDTSEDTDFVKITVKDEGPGFTEKDKKQLFIKFKKLSAKPTSKEASSGLGLYIVKQLTELIGVTISVNSEPGKGAEFILLVPKKKK